MPRNRGASRKWANGSRTCGKCTSPIFLRWPSIWACLFRRGFLPRKEKTIGRPRRGAVRQDWWKKKGRPLARTTTFSCILGRRLHFCPCAVNPFDTYMRTGTYAQKPALPYTPGSDGAGMIEAVGEGVKKVKAGDRVYTAKTVTGAYAEYALALEG